MVGVDETGSRVSRSKIICRDLHDDDLRATCALDNFIHRMNGRNRKLN